MSVPRRLFAAAFVMLAGGIAAAAVGHARQDPARDAGARRGATTATLRLTGSVFAADADRRPVRGAKVTIAQGMLTAPISAVTGPDGRFEFTGVAPGNYSLVVMRTGYVTTYYGARTPGRGPGVPIALIEGRDPPALEVELLRAASISGTVRSANGHPIANAYVQAVGDGANTFLPLVTGPVSQTGTTTDDRGEYRLHGLAPGSYLIGVRSDFRQLTNMARPITDEEIRWADAAVRAGAASPLSAPPPVAAPALHAPVFYPASPDAARATPIVLAAGDDRTGIDLATSLVTTASARGVVYGEDGGPAAGALVQVEAARPDPFDMGLTSMLRSARSDAAGVFAIQGIPPGDYRVTARLAEPPQPTPPSTAMAGLAAMALAGATGTLGGPAGWFATEPIVVNERDLDGLSLRLTRVPAVTARVIYADPVPEPAPAAPAFMLMAVATGTAQADTALALRSSSLFMANEDGTFTARGVLPGRYVVAAFDLVRMAGPAGGGMASGLPAGAWTLVSAVTGGRDIADEPVEIAGRADFEDLVVTFTNRPAEISGTVIDRADRPTGAFPIVIFSTNRAHWLPGARRTQLIRPTTSGTYRAPGLPPGEYYLAAVTDVEDRALGDPSFLEQLVPGAMTITLGAGEKKVQDLRLGGG